MKFHATMLAILGVFCASAVATAPVGAQHCASAGASYQRSYSTTYSAYKAPVSYAKSYAQSYATVVDYQEQPYVLKLKAVVPLLELPTYSVGVYTPPPQAPCNVNPIPGQSHNPAQQQQSQGELQQILKGLTEVTTTLRDFDSRIRRLEERSGGVPLPQPQLQPKQMPRDEGKGQAKQNGSKVSFATTNANFCAACHEKGKEDRGGDFVFTVDGKMPKFTNDQIVSIQKHVGRGTMPKLNETAKKHGITRQLTAEERDSILFELDAQVFAPEEKKQ